MAYTDTGEIRLEKSIVIDANQAKQMEARNQVLPSDEYVERDRGENLAPAQFVQEVVDATTAARLAAQKGVNLMQSIDQAAGVNFGGDMSTETQTGKSKIPSAILESFRKQPPIVPQMQSTVGDFDPVFIANVQEANRRLNKAGGDIVTRIPENATKQTLNEMRVMPPPVTNYPQQFQTYSAPSPVVSASVDYSVMAALMKDAVREVLKETNLKDIVKEVLKEEREGLAKSSINENIEIKIGNSVFSGKISSMKVPKK